MKGLNKEKKVKKSTEGAKKFKQTVTVLQRKNEDNTIEISWKGLEISTSMDDAICPVYGTMYSEGVNNDFWICCDGYDMWLELKCTNMQNEKIPDEYFCAECMNSQLK